MLSARARRVGLSVLILLVLALPAGAQAKREQGLSLERIISSIWGRFSSPPVIPREWIKGRGCIDPDGAPAPCPATTTSSPVKPPPTDGRE